MARTIAPGQPTPIEPVNVKVPDFDLEIFDKVGDAKIKSATQNFQLYATTTANAEAQKAYQKYKNNPIALANALKKLPGMFDDLPESIQTQLKQKLDTNAISLVQKAQANQEKNIAKQNKALAHANATLNMTQLADDYFNVLRYITAPEGEKRPGDLAIYRQHRAELEQLVNMTDEDGKPLFSEAQRAKMLMPKEAALAGFKQFINRAEQKDLQDWYKTVFANQGKFIEDTSIDPDVYESMNTAIKARLTTLENDKELGVHGQAYFDELYLINNPTQMAIEKAKSYPFTNDKAIDKAVESAKKMTLGAWYDPTKRTAPDAFVIAYNLFGDAIQNNDWSPEGREQAVAQAYMALEKLQDWAQESNMSPQTVQTIRDTVVTALTNKEAQQTILNSGLKEIYFPEPTTEREKQIQSITGRMDEFNPRTHQIRTEDDAISNAQALAIENYGYNLERAMPYYIAHDYDNFKEAVSYAAKQYKMDAASFIVKDGYEWERLERELADGKKPIYNYMGRMLEFKGFDNKSAVFQEIF